jgi:hypothetical protein
MANVLNLRAPGITAQLSFGYFTVGGEAAFHEASVAPHFRNITRYRGRFVQDR